MEKLTTRKKSNLILNVDGTIGCAFTDLLRYSGDPPRPNQKTLSLPRALPHPHSQATLPRRRRRSTLALDVSMVSLYSDDRSVRYIHKPYTCRTAAYTSAYTSAHTSAYRIIIALTVLRTLE